MLPDASGVDLSSPHASGTPARVAKMFLGELFAGLTAPKPALTEFPNDEGIDQMLMVGPIAVRSTCAHHLAPILGRCWIGVLPSQQGNLLGLSKYARLARWVFARPCVQEDATKMLADELEAALDPVGLGVIVEAEHACMRWRGVKETAALMVTQDLRRALRDDSDARQEFLRAVGRL